MKESEAAEICKLSGELTALAVSTKKQNNLLLGMDDEEFIWLVNEECQRLMETGEEVKYSSRKILDNYKKSFREACENIAGVRKLVIA